MAMGNMGPKRTPMNEIAMALPIRDGMNHIVSSKLFRFEKKFGSQLESGKKRL